MIESLADRIYEAAFVPDLWPALLDDMAAISGSVSGSICVLPNLDHPFRYRSTSVTREALERMVSTNQWRANRRGAAILDGGLAHRIDGFLYADAYLPEEQDESCCIAHVLRECGLGEQLHTAIPMPRSGAIIYTFERWAGEGRHSVEQVATMNMVRPHLARAGLIASHLALEQATATLAALTALRLPACILRRSGAVLSTNPLFDDLSSLFIASAFGGIALADPVADRLLQAAIGDASRATDRPRARSIAIAARPGRDAAILHILPLRRTAHEIFSGADLMLVVNRPDRALGIPTNAVVSALFDFSPAEARLARHLASGLSLTAAARKNGITIKTARTYVERIFAKAGTHRQGELIALLRSVRSLDPPR